MNFPSLRPEITGNAAVSMQRTCDPPGAPLSSLHQITHRVYAISSPVPHYLFQLCQHPLPRSGQPKSCLLKQRLQPIIQVRAFVLHSLLVRPVLNDHLFYGLPYAMSWRCLGIW
jgi:hypothetical protein